MPEISKPSEQDYTRSIKEILNQTDISYQGTEKFEGRSVYNIKASPKNGTMLWACIIICWWTVKTGCLSR